jgi:hypothetical protein
MTSTVEGHEAVKNWRLYPVVDAIPASLGRGGYRRHAGTDGPRSLRRPAVNALREDAEHVIEDVRLTPQQITTLGFWGDVTA